MRKKSQTDRLRYKLGACLFFFISVLCNGPCHTNYKTNYLHQCIVLKNLFYTLKPSTYIKIYFNMCRRF